MFKTKLWFNILLLSLLAACGQSTGGYSSTAGKKRRPSCKMADMMYNALHHIGTRKQAVTVQQAQLLDRSGNSVLQYNPPLDDRSQRAQS
jgi:hypothetical protein